jgi:hypothetical protein
MTESSAPSRFLPQTRATLFRRLGAAIQRPGGYFRYRSRALRRGYHVAARVLHPRTWLSRCRASLFNGNPGPFDIERQRGYVLVPPGTRGAIDTTEVVREVRALVAATDIAGVRAAAKKPYLLTLLKTEEVSPDSAVFRFVTNEQIVTSAARYLRCLPLLTYIAVWYSPNDSTEDDGSQKFHLDHEDLRQVKGFLFIEDVDESSGPFTLLDAAASTTVQRAVNYRMTASEKRLDDDVVFGIVDRQRAMSLTGPAGTVALTDTSQCFHYGSRAGRRPRVLLAFQYLTPFAFVMPWRWRAYAPLQVLRHAGASERVRQLLG